MFSSTKERLESTWRAYSLLLSQRRLSRIAVQCEPARGRYRSPETGATAPGSSRFGTTGRLALGGVFSGADVGTIERGDSDRGEIQVTGTIENTGGTFAVPDGAGPWHFNGGTIRGGQVDATGLIAANTLALENVTLSTDLDLRLSGALPTLVIRGDLTLDGTRIIAGQRLSQALRAEEAIPGQGVRLLGSGEILFTGGGNSANRLTSSASVHIGAGIAVRATDTPASVRSFADLTNEGTIDFGGASSASLLGDLSFLNTGVVSAAGTTILSINENFAQWTNRGLLRLASTNAARSGDFLQGASGTLEIVIQSAGTFARLEGDTNPAATFTLGGTLSVEFAAGFDPAVGTSWKILEAPSRAGEFSVVTSNLTGGKTLGVTYDADGVTVTVE